MNQIFTLLFLAALLVFGSAQGQPTKTIPLPNGISYDITHTGTQSPGYLFLGSYPFDLASSRNSTIMILDNEGVPAFYKDHPLDTSIIADLRMHANGYMSYGFNDLLTDQFMYIIMDSNFTVLDTIACGNGLRTDGHDMILLDNGNYLLICLEEYLMDLSSIYTFDGYQGATQGEVLAPVIQEVSIDDNVVFEWKGVDYYNIEDIDPYFFFDSSFLDFGHANSLAMDLDGNILFSLRYFNEITKINYQNSEIIWRMGGLRNEFTFINDPQWFSGQHHCTVRPNGNLTMYDNGERGNPPLARGVEYALDQTNKTATKVWEYANDTGLISYSLGSLHRMENGNNVIGWGAGFPPFFSNDVVEIDTDGNQLMAFDWPELYYTYRAYKYQLDWSMEKLRPVISCDTAIDGEVELTAMGDFDSYWWNTGETTASIKVSVPGDYFVLAKNDTAIGHFGSRLMTITNIDAVCRKDTTVGISSFAQPMFEVYPNPASNYLTVNNVGNHTNSTLLLYNTLGAEVYRTSIGNGISTLPIGHLAKGSYVGVISSEHGKQAQRFKLIVSH